MTNRRKEWLFWLAASLPPLVIYARTMAPGLIARGDTPKFQYLGVILGTAHAPGYPLFIGLSWLFSKLPFGTVAWRINVMTILFGALAAALTAWAARGFGAGRASALVAAWGLAFAPVFWGQAVSAEVYTLAAALQAASLGFVARWQQTRRDRHLIAAVAVSALALGHHPTFLMIVPALVVFVLATDWRVLLRPRLTVSTLLLVAAGLAQYAYVVIRTRQGSRYIEASARNLSELLLVLRGTQYEDSLFAFGWRDILDGRLAHVWSFVAGELSLVGLVLAATGWLSLAWRNWRAATLLALSGLTVFAFALTYDVGDTHVFLIPVFVVLWILAAVGLHAAASVAPVRRQIGAAVAIAVSVGLATMMVTKSYALQDLSQDTFDDEYLNAMFGQISLPAEIYSMYNDSTSHALRYKLYVERRGRRSVQPGFVKSADPIDGPASRGVVYSFESARQALEARGLLLSRVALESALSSRLAALAAGSTVAIALAANAVRSLGADDLSFLQQVGARRVSDGIPQAVIVSGGRVVAEEFGRLAVARGPHDLTSEASEAEAAIAIRGNEIVRIAGGAAIAAIDTRGQVLWAEPLNRGEGIRPLVDTGPRPIHRAIGRAPCRDVKPGDWAAFAAEEIIGTRLTTWTGMPGEEPDGRAVTVVSYLETDTRPPRTAAMHTSGERLNVVEIDFDLRDEASRATLLEQRQRDGVSRSVAGRFVSRTTYRVGRSEFGEISSVQVVNERPSAIDVRVETSDAVPVRLCSSPVAGVVAFGDDSERRIELVRGHAELTGAGWNAGEGGGRDFIRWTSASRSEMRFTLPAAMPLKLTVHAGHPRPGAGDRIQVAINGSMLAAYPLAGGDASYDWEIPATLVTRGYNELVLHGPAAVSPLESGTGPDPRRLGLAVRAVTLRR